MEEEKILGNGFIDVNYKENTLQSIKQFLKELPVHNEENFSLYNVDNARTKRPS